MEELNQISERKPIEVDIILPAEEPLRWPRRYLHWCEEIPHRTTQVSILGGGGGRMVGTC